MKRIISLAFALLCSITVVAQSTNPTLIFTASVDHDDPAQAPFGYNVQARDLNTNAVLFVRDLGKPTYDPIRDILVPFSTLPNFYQQNGAYQLEVASYGLGGVSALVQATPSFIYCPIPPSPLVITCPPNQSAVSSTPTNVTWLDATATGGTPPYTFAYNPANGSVFPIGTTLVTAVVTDVLNVSNSCNFNVTVTQPTGGTFTIGESAILATPDDGNGNLLFSQSASLPQAATIQSLSFYVVGAAGKFRLGIYDSARALRATTDEMTPIANSWNTGSVVTPVQLPAGTYWLAILPSSNGLSFRKTSNGTSSGRFTNQTYGPLPATFVSNPSTTPSHWSFYATFSN